MRKRWIAASTAALMLGLAACSGRSGSNGGGEGGGSLTLAALVDAQPWDLKDAGLGNNTPYYQPVYDSLFRLNPAAEVEPNLVTEWEYDETLTRLTVTLREDVTFTDGEAFNAEVVKANLLNTKGGTNEAANQLKSVADVEVVDEYTAVIVLNAPDPSLLPNLGSVPGMMASPAAIGTPGLATTPVGSGPYVLDSARTTPGSTYTFTRNADYWNPDAFPFDEIVITPLTDATATLNALQRGQIDGAVITDPNNVPTLEAAGLNILKYPSGDVGGLYIWDRAGDLVPALGELEVRQAMNHAFDRQAIIDAAFAGQGEPTTQVFNPDGAAYDPALDDLYPYDPQKARDLLAEAGYPDGFDLPMIDLSAFFPGAQAAIVEQLGEVGINVQLESVPPDQVIDALLTGRYGASFFTLASFRPWDTIQIEIAPDALWNPFQYSDPVVTDLIEDARAATGDDQNEIIRQINEYTVEQAWNAPWYIVENAYAHSDDVTVTPQTFAAVPGIYNFAPAE